MRHTLLMLSILPLAACAASSGAYEPQSVHSLDKDISALNTKFAVATSIEAYYAQAETRQRRDEFVAARLALYDLEYLRFVNALHLSRAQQNTLFDATSLGLGLGTTLSAGERAKTVLGAVATAFTGLRASYDKNFFSDQTTNALVTQMAAERKKALVTILQRLDGDVDAYPLLKAIADLQQYREAGTLVGAVQAVQRDAVESDEQATKKLNQYRVGSFAPDETSDRINNWLYPKLDRFEDDNALDSNGNQVNIDPANRQALEKEIARQSLGGVPWPVFVNNGKFAAERAKAARELKIP